MPAEDYRRPDGGGTFRAICRIAVGLGQRDARLLAGTADSDVPCDGCTACCRSSFHLEIEPDEVDTLAHIPAEFLIVEPELGVGHSLVAPDEHGHCVLLVDGACSIYEHRPRTCRTFDCRVFVATGVDADADRPLIVAASSLWEFDPAHDLDLRELAALRSAVASIPVDGNAEPPTNLAGALHAVGISADFLADLA